MMIRILILIFIFMCSSFKPVLADPTPSISYLMNEPASLFDLGMFKLNWHLKNTSILFGTKFDSKSVTVDAIYTFDQNQITIGFSAGEVMSNIDAGKEYCQEIIGGIKKTLFVNPHTGIPFDIGGMNTYKLIFSHEGFYEKKDQPKNLYSDLAKITKIFGRVIIEKKESFFFCISSLLSKEITYSQE